MKKNKTKPGYFNQGSSGGSGSEYRYSSEKARAPVVIKPSSGKLRTGRMPRRRTGSSVSTARDTATWHATARSRVSGQEEEEEEDDHDGTGEIVSPVSDVLSTNKYNDDDSLDFLEGVGLVDQWDLVNELKGKPVEEIEKDI